jgi:hypothetical protein
MTTLQQVVATFRDVGGVPAGEVLRHERALRKVGLIPQRGETAVTADDAVWLLLTVLTGSVQRAREAARLTNSRQMIGDVIVNEGDCEMHVFDGIRDAINLRRSGALINAGCVRLLEQGGAFTAAICLHANTGVLWHFQFGQLVELTDPDPVLWRVSVASPKLIDGIAALFEPLAAHFQASAQPLGILELPATVGAEYQAVTMH